MAMIIVTRGRRLKTETATVLADSSLTGACRVRSCARTNRRTRGALHTTANRATLGQPPSGAAVHAEKQAAGAPSVWSQFFNHPSRDHTDGATLGRRRRTRRPVFREAPATAYTSRLPTPPAVSRIRDSNHYETEGAASPTLRQAGRQSPQ